MPSKRSTWFARNERAEALETEGKRDEALELYLKNAEEGCDIAFTYERIAVIYGAKDRPERALKAMERALEIQRGRGPSAKTVRLEQRVKQFRRISEKKTKRKRQLPVRERSTRSPMRTTGGREGKKGCLSILVLSLISLGLLTGSFII